MQRYRVQCVDRQTGQEHAVLVDALDAEAAKAWAIDEGWLVGRVEAEAAPAIAHTPQTAVAPAQVLAPQPHASAQALVQPAPHAQPSFALNQADSTEALRAIAKSLEVIAGSAIIAKPRRTLVWCVLLGAGLGGLATVMLQLAVGLAFPSSAASGLTGGLGGGLTGGLGGGSGVSQSQVDAAMKSIQDYGNQLKKAADNPLGD